MIIKEAFPNQVVNHMTKLKCRPEPASFIYLSHDKFSKCQRFLLSDGFLNLGVISLAYVPKSVMRRRKLQS
jgi:hypothetical protein